MLNVDLKEKFSHTSVLPVGWPLRVAVASECLRPIWLTWEVTPALWWQVACSPVRILKTRFPQTLHQTSFLGITTEKGYKMENCL